MAGFSHDSLAWPRNWPRNMPGPGLGRSAGKFAYMNAYRRITNHVVPQIGRRAHEFVPRPPEQPGKLCRADPGAREQRALSRPALHFDHRLIELVPKAASLLALLLDEPPE